MNSSFTDRLHQAIDQSAYKGNYKSLSEDAGLSSKQISNLLNKKEINNSPIGPGLFAMQRVCQLVGCDLDWLASGRPGTTSTLGDNALVKHIVRLGEAARGQFLDSTKAPDPQALHRLYDRSGGRLEAFEPVLQYCDLYEPISEGDTAVTVRAIGEFSLSGLTMGTTCASELQFALENSDDKELMPLIVQSHLDAKRYGSISVTRSLDIPMPNRPVKVKMDYILTALRLSDSSGEEVTFIYTALIPH